MNDSGGDSWSNGGWIKIESINGNVMFKGMMTEMRTQTEPISLYSPINKYSTWMYTPSALGEWKSISYDDDSWIEYTVDDNTTTGQGIQYFRKVFTGVNNMAAFEIQLNYKDGIVAYINGAEVYRDNMAEGIPTNSTLATGSYTSYGYHGILRPANDVTVSNIIAVEVHPMSMDYSAYLEFDGFISLMAGMSSTNKCFVVPNELTVTATGFTNPVNAISYTHATEAYLSSPPGSLTFEISGSSLPLINSFRLWPYVYYLLSPKSFSIDGAMSTLSNWETVLTVSDHSYTANIWAQWDLITALPKYSRIRFNVQSKSVKVYEFQFLVCNRIPPTTFSYPQTQYSYYMKYEEVNISPTMNGLSGCSISLHFPTECPLILTHALFLEYQLLPLLQLHIWSHPS